MFTGHRGGTSARCALPLEVSEEERDELLRKHVLGFFNSTNREMMKHMRKTMDDDGFVALDEFLFFLKVRRLTKDPAVLARALQSSPEVCVATSCHGPYHTPHTVHPTPHTPYHASHTTHP